MHGAEAAGQFQAPEPVLFAPLQLGEEVRRGGIPNYCTGELRRVFGLESIKDPEGNVINV